MEHSYSIKPFPDSNFALNLFKFEGFVDVVSHIWGLGFCLGLLKSNLGFIEKFGV